MIDLKNKVDQIYPPSILLLLLTLVTLGIVLFFVIAILGKFGLLGVCIIVVWVGLAVISLKNCYIRMRIFHLYKSDHNEFLDYLKYLYEKESKKRSKKTFENHKMLQLLSDLIAEVELMDRKEELDYGITN